MEPTAGTSDKNSVGNNSFWSLTMPLQGERVLSVVNRDGKEEKSLGYSVGCFIMPFHCGQGGHGQVDSKT